MPALHQRHTLLYIAGIKSCRLKPLSALTPDTKTFGNDGIERITARSGCIQQHEGYEIHKGKLALGYTATMHPDKCHNHGYYHGYETKPVKKA